MISSPLLANPTAVITGPDEVTFANEQIARTPGPGEVLIKTCYSLISPGTELAIFQHTHVGFPDPANTFAKYPFRPGYAAAGRVVDIGAGVSGLAEGDWVFHPGRHQAYALAHTEKGIVLRLPDDADPKLALFTRMAQIASSALEVSTAASGGSVAVLGQGLVGNIAAQLFQRRGCAVLGVDLIASRCAIAERCGLRSQLVTAETAVTQVRSAFAESGPATVVEATGHPLAVATALQMTARGGEMILLGSTRGKVEIDVYKLIHSPGVTVRGAHENVLSLFGGNERPRELLARNLKEIVAGRLVIEPLLSQVIDYRDLGAGYRRLCDNPADVLSIVVEWPE
jgi:2-desacetyl-2-hydroxyethyl bacteriochlorophyllide A dehydrogenase